MAKRTIDDLLSERHKRFTPLQRLLRKGANHTSWTAQVRALAPQELADKIWVANRTADELTLNVADAATGTLLRFQVPTLIQALAQLADFQGISSIRIRVNAKLSEPLQTVEPVAPSDTNRDEVPHGNDYQRLEAALLRLRGQFSKSKKKS